MTQLSGPQLRPPGSCARGECDNPLCNDVRRTRIREVIRVFFDKIRTRPTKSWDATEDTEYRRKLREAARHVEAT